MPRRAACLLLLVSCLTPEAASACSIISPERSQLRADIERVDAAVVGTVLSTRQLPMMLPTQTRVSVEAVIAGDVTEPVIVVRSDQASACGLESSPGERVGLLLSRHDGQWRSGLGEMRPPDWLTELANEQRGWLARGLANLQSVARRITHPAFPIRDGVVVIGDGPVRYTGTLIGTATGNRWQYEACVGGVYSSLPPTCGDDAVRVAGIGAEPASIPTMQVDDGRAWSRLPVQVGGVQIRGCVARRPARECALFVQY